MTGKAISPDTAPQRRTRVRISDEMRQVIELMATEGLPLPQAAEQANITRDSAARAIKKKHVINLLKQRLKEVRDNAAQEAYLRINHLARTADNKRLAFDASRWVAGVDGISPVQKVQGQHHHSHSFEGFEYPDLEPIEGDAIDSQDDD